MFSSRLPVKPAAPISNFSIAGDTIPNNAGRSTKQSWQWLNSGLRLRQSPFQRGALLLTGGAEGAQPGAGPRLAGSHSQPGFASGPRGTADQVGTGERPAVEPCATVERADQSGMLSAPATIDWSDQAGRAVVQTRTRANQQLGRTGVFTCIDAMLLRGCWHRLPLTLGGQHCWRMERLPALSALSAAVVPTPRGPLRRPREVGLGQPRVQRRQGGCSSPREQ